MEGSIHIPDSIKPDPRTGVAYMGTRREDLWMVPTEEVTIMEERTVYAAAAEHKVGANHPSSQVECATVIERLGEISGQLGGCRKALESLVGCPMDGEKRPATDPTCTMVHLTDLVDDIYLAVREVSNQIERLSRGLG